MPDTPPAAPAFEPGPVPAEPREPRKRASELRSARWFGPADLRSFGHRSRAMQMGYAPEEWTGKPVIAILNTWSDLQPCHMHFKQRVDDVKRGILMAGGFPVELPALSLSESYLKPTSMLYRNMLAMEAEELLRSHPVDGAVLMGGCDKSTPGLLLGATSMDVPAIFLPAGPMLRGNWQGVVLGSGSDSWKYWDELRAGTITDQDWLGVEGGIARSYGTCMTMGTASTMTAIAEAVGMVLPGGSSIPAADAGHIRLASESGRRIVAMVWEDLTPKRIQTRAAFGNAIAVAMAMGCSTNAIIHLIAMARRAGHHVGLADFEHHSRRVPVIGNVRPSGDRYLMEDFFYAGGIRALMQEIREHLDLGCLTVTGRTLGENIAGARVYDADVIRPTSRPIYREGSLAVLHGNLDAAVACFGRGRHAHSERPERFQIVGQETVGGIYQQGKGRRFSHLGFRGYEGIIVGRVCVALVTGDQRLPCLHHGIRGTADGRVLANGQKHLKLSIRTSIVSDSPRPPRP